MVVYRVVLLDQESFQVELPKNAYGQALFDNVKQKLNLEEADYFGLSFRNSQNLRFWLNLEKRIDKQVESIKDMVFYWEVKFYPPAPEQLNEDLTRYLVVLQIRQDLFTGALPASFQTLAILGSFTAQGEIGDYDKTQHIGIEYLRAYSFAPNPSEELLMRISDLHKTCKGLTPAEADLYFLENAKKCAQYGMEMHSVKDSSNRQVKVGVCASGLYVYHGKLRIECFKWPRMLKIEYKRNVFRIKVRPAEFEHHQQTLGFQLPSVKLAKRLWRIAVENHQFFRLKQPELTDTGTLRGFGSRRWRMSGRTQAQLRGVGTPRKSFSRSNSIGSSDANYPLHQSTGTMPVPTNRRPYRATDMNKNYNTFGGRVNGGTDHLVDISMDDGGEYIPADAVEETSVARDPQNITHLPPDTSAGATIGSDNLVNGAAGTEPDSALLPEVNSLYNRPSGSLFPRKPVPPQRYVTDESSNGVTANSAEQPISIENTLVAAGAPQLSSINSQSAVSEPDAASTQYQPTTAARLNSSSNVLPSSIAVSPTAAKGSLSPPNTSPRTQASPVGGATKFGVGELPMPCFSLESVGVMPTGGIDHSVKLNTAERAEKVIKVGVPPTVKTTCMKFAGGSAELNTHSTWSPPTVKTEKRHFNYMPNSHTDLNGYSSSPHERISKTTTFTTERDGYVEKKVKHTITLSGEEDIDDQLLLNAIQAVTGLDNTLGVDRIEIKTETECA